MKLISDEDYKWFLKKKKSEQQDIYWREQRRIAEEIADKRIKALGYTEYCRVREEEANQLEKDRKRPRKEYPYPYTKEMHEENDRQIRRCKYQREFERQYTVWFAFKYLNYYGMPLKHLAIIECY